MTDKKCIYIDCARCANPECPNKRKEVKRMVADISIKAYDKYFEGTLRNPWRK